VGDDRLPARLFLLSEVMFYIWSDRGQVTRENPASDPLSLWRPL